MRSALAGFHGFSDVGAVSHFGIWSRRRWKFGSESGEGIGAGLAEGIEDEDEDENEDEDEHRQRQLPGEAHAEVDAIAAKSARPTKRVGDGAPIEFFLNFRMLCEVFISLSNQRSAISNRPDGAADTTCYPENEQRSQGGSR